MSVVTAVTGCSPTTVSNTVRQAVRTVPVLTTARSHAPRAVGRSPTTAWRTAPRATGRSPVTARSHAPRAAGHSPATAVIDDANQYDTHVAVTVRESSLRVPDGETDRSQRPQARTPHRLFYSVEPATRAAPPASIDLQQYYCNKNWTLRRANGDRETDTSVARRVPAILSKSRNVALCVLSNQTTCGEVEYKHVMRAVVY